MKDIINDLIAEQSLVDSLLDGLTEEQWKLPLNGCQPWILQDAVNHIAFFDYAANRLMDHEFKDLLDGLDAEAEQDADYIPWAFRNYSGAETLAWWRAERTKMVFKFMNKDPKERIPWAPGMPMSAKSLCSARLMELWAHSVDIYDALGMDVVVKNRIKSVLFLSWQARPFAYAINGSSFRIHRCIWSSRSLTVQSGRKVIPLPRIISKARQKTGLWFLSAAATGWTQSLK